jgi:hypothetical protein
LLWSFSTTTQELGEGGSRHPQVPFEVNGKNPPIEIWTMDGLSSGHGRLYRVGLMPDQNEDWKISRP